MIDPVLRIRHPIQRRALNEDRIILTIEIHVSDYSRFFRHWRRDAYALEEGRDDEIDVLAWVGEETDHGECDERAHGAAVVVALEARVSWLKVSGNVEVGAFG